MSEMSVTIPTASWNRGGAQPPIRWVTLHDEEYPQTINSAEDVANFFASRPYGEYGSAHYVSDYDSIEHCVPEGIAAYHAPALSYMGSVGIEQDGYAKNSLAEWLTNLGKGTIAHTAALTAELCVRHGIPVRYVNAAGLNAQQPGITSHWEVNHSIYGQTDHWDPGYSFPWTDFFNLTNLAVATLKGDLCSWQKAHGLEPDGDPGRLTVTKIGDAMRDTWIRGAIPVPAKPKIGYHRYDDCPLIQVGASDASARPANVTNYPGWPVFSAQHALNKLHAVTPALVEDGEFGPNTAAATRAFQRRCRMVCDGAIGRATWTALAKQLTDAGF